MCCVVDMLKDTTVYFVLIMVFKSTVFLNGSCARLDINLLGKDVTAIPFFSFGLAVYLCQ